MADLGGRISVWRAVLEVTLRDGIGRALNVDEWSKPEADEPQAQEDGRDQSAGSDQNFDKEKL
jgi:hypothetical protein